MSTERCCAVKGTFKSTRFLMTRASIADGVIGYLSALILDFALPLKQSLIFIEAKRAISEMGKAK